MINLQKVEKSLLLQMYYNGHLLDTFVKVGSVYPEGLHGQLWTIKSGPWGFHAVGAHDRAGPLTQQGNTQFC